MAKRISKAVAERRARGRARHHAYMKALRDARGRGFDGPTSGPGSWTRIRAYCVKEGILTGGSSAGAVRARTQRPGARVLGLRFSGRPPLRLDQHDDILRVSSLHDLSHDPHPVSLFGHESQLEEISLPVSLQAEYPPCQ